MFEESEIETEIDFVPKKKQGYAEFCKKQCRNATHCPIEYVCPTLERWINADMDHDNTL